MAEQDLTPIEAKACFDFVDAEGKVIDTAVVYRGAVPLFEFLTNWQKTNPEGSELATKVAKVVVYLKVPPEVKLKDGRERLVIAEGTLPEVVEILHQRIMPSPAALMKLQATIGYMAEFSNMKGIIITGVFDDAQAVGFGFLSESTELKDGDIEALVSAAEGQLDMFKDAMRKKRNIQFEGDKGKLFIPGKGPAAIHLAKPAP